MNPHALRHMPLKHACLPFHHPSDRLRPDKLLAARTAGKVERGFRVCLPLILLLILLLVLASP